MKAYTINEIKTELEQGNTKQLFSLCLKLAKFKKENKELLAFLLFESGDIPGYVEKINAETKEYFNDINNSNTYYIKKSIRKILRYINKHIKFISTKPAEAEIRIHFCNCMTDAAIPFHKSKQLLKIYEGQLAKVSALLLSLHPDLQYDLKKQIKVRPNN
ncbi:MAG: hypothetical protein M3R50_07885 [Bacteroidota bacterium]|nr:hypothetical protein [Bacteroidota bacterium]